MAKTQGDRATLADVLAAVKAAAPMTDRRRQDMASAVNTVARVLCRSLAEIPADLRGLNAKLKYVSPKAMGITPARWNNVRSLFRSALALIGPVMKGHNAEPISEGWGHLYRTITVRSDRIRLSRLLRWLTAQEITPATVTAEDLAHFHRILSEEALLRDPAATWADTARAWNRAAERIAGWPQLKIRRDPQERVCAPLVHFPR